MSNKKKSKKKVNSYMAKKDVPLEHLETKRDKLLTEVAEMKEKESALDDEKSAELKDVDSAICKEQVAANIKQYEGVKKQERVDEIISRVEDLKEEIKILEKEKLFLVNDLTETDPKEDAAKLNELKSVHEKISKKHDTKIGLLKKSIDKKTREVEKLELRIGRRKKKVESTVDYVSVSPPNRGTGETFKREEEATNE